MSSDLRCTFAASPNSSRQCQRERPYRRAGGHLLPRSSCKVRGSDFMIILHDKRSERLLAPRWRSESIGWRAPIPERCQKAQLIGRSLSSAPIAGAHGARPRHTLLGVPSCRAPIAALPNRWAHTGAAYSLSEDLLCCRTLARTAVRFYACSLLGPSYLKITSWPTASIAQWQSVSLVN